MVYAVKLNIVHPQACGSSGSMPVDIDMLHQYPLSNYARSMLPR